jgi:phage-related protein
VLKAAGETETTHENNQDWLELDEGDPGFQLLTEETAALIFFNIYFHQFYLHYYIFHLFVS